MSSLIPLSCITHSKNQTQTTSEKRDLSTKFIRQTKHSSYEISFSRDWSLSQAYPPSHFPPIFPSPHSRICPEKIQMYSTSRLVSKAAQINFLRCQLHVSGTHDLVNKSQVPSSCFASCTSISGGTSLSRGLFAARFCVKLYYLCKVSQIQTYKELGSVPLWACIASASKVVQNWLLS